MDKITAIYIRVSTDRQAEEGYSIDAQKEQLTALCISKKWNNYDYYIDGGWSGSNIDRPEMSRLISDINEDKIERVVVYKLDRLSRSQKDILYLIEDVFIPKDVSFVSHTESLDTSTPMGRAMIGIIGAFAQLERENIHMRTRMGMLERVKDGYWMGGGRIPFGYNYDKELGILVPNDDAEIVKKIYELYIKGLGAQTIANMLGLKYEKLVSQIIVRKSNYGMIEYNGEVYQGRHKPIISKETYDIAMAEKNKRALNKTTTSKYLLSGLLYCKKCGAKLRYQKWRNGAVKLICYSQQKSKMYLVKDINCDLKKLDSEEVEKTVLEKLFALNETLIDGKDDNDANKKKTIDILYTQKNSLEKQIKKLFNLYSTMEDDLLLETIEENKKKLLNIERSIKSELLLEEETRKKRIYNENIENLEERWDTLSFRKKQEILRILINRIEVSDDNVRIVLNI